MNPMNPMNPSNSMSQEDFLLHYAKRCPAQDCISLDITPLGPTPSEEGLVIAQPYACRDCGAEWMRIHALQGYESLTLLADNPEPELHKSRNPTTKGDPYAQALPLLQAIQKESPSTMLDHALKALTVFENTPGCEIDMETFHRGDPGLSNENPFCFACLGGAAALVRLGVPQDQWWEVDYREFGHYVHRGDPAHLPHEENLLTAYENALDEARCGEVGDLFLFANLDPTPASQFSRDHVDFHIDPEIWREQMDQLVEDLRQAGY